MKCLQCNNEFKAQRKTAKYCSTKCRKLAFQQNGKVSVPQVSVPQGTMTPESLKPQVPTNYGGPDCACRHCKQTKTNKLTLILNHGAYKTADQLDHDEINRVSLPGDIDYEGIVDLSDSRWHVFTPTSTASFSTMNKPLKNHRTRPSYPPMRRWLQSILLTLSYFLFLMTLR